MNLLINGRGEHVPDAETVTALLQAIGYADRRVAVEVNGEIVPRSRHGDHRLAEGDRVEIVQAIGGG